MAMDIGKFITQLTNSIIFQRGGEKPPAIKYDPLLGMIFLKCGSKKWIIVHLGMIFPY